MPIKLGTAKIQEYTHTLIFYNDLGPLIVEINKLSNKSKDLLNSVNSHKEYAYDASNYIKILLLTKEKVEIKLSEILFYPKRVKRGMINGLGSIFKAISGNLDANDGERYEKMISNLKTNQGKLAETIVKQNSISINLVNQFNLTISKIMSNEKLLNEKITQINEIVKRHTIRENMIFIKDILIQVINMYEIINSILQDVENSISFAKQKIIHPSIIKTQDLYSELLKLQNETLKKEQFPFKITYETTLFYENLIKVNAFILNNKITYLLKVPITYSIDFNYYHLYSIPIYFEGQFKSIVPRDKYLLENELYFSYKNKPCMEIYSQYFYCENADLQETKETNPCEIQLLHKKNTSTCRQIQVKISKSLIKQTDQSNQYIGVFPNQERIEFNCNQEKEEKTLFGSFLFEIPTGCAMTTPKETFSNENQKPLKNQLIIFPKLTELYYLPQPNVTIQIEDINLDELQKIKAEIIQNQPHLEDQFLSSPNLWTTLILISIIFSICYLLFGLCQRRFRRKPVKSTTTEMVDFSTVQLNPQVS